jgi:two-component system phosphate regulon sensor histidine kinase PhoR
VIGDWPSYFAHRPPSPRRLALELAATFAMLGIIWMSITDVFLYALTRDVILAARVEIALDWLFIAVAGTLIYATAHRAAVRLSRTRLVLASVVESIGDGLLLLGPDRRIVYANPAALEMLACRRAAELEGMDAESFGRRFLLTYPSGALVQPEKFASQRAFDEEGAIRYKAIMHPTPGRETVFVATAAGVRTRPGDRAPLVVSLMHDVTDTEHLERMRDRFFASTAHALKTPVAIIKANVQHIVQSTPETPRPSFHAIERQCDRIDRLVQNLQVISRARSHSLELHLRLIDLAPIVAQVAREVAAWRPDGARDAVWSTTPVYGDRERLTTAVRNLAIEAIHQATQRSPVSVELEVHGHHARLRVRFEPLPLAERTFFGHEDYDDDALSHTATETIVAAHGGEVGSENGDREASLWMRLPIMEDPRGPDERRADRR